jgi:hypothetical protein
MCRLQQEGSGITSNANGFDHPPEQGPRQKIACLDALRTCTGDVDQLPSRSDVSTRESVMQRDAIRVARMTASIS